MAESFFGSPRRSDLGGVILMALVRGTHPTLAVSFVIYSHLILGMTLCDGTSSGYS